jgi:hypothetical protein
MRSGTPCHTFQKRAMQRVSSFAVRPVKSKDQSAALASFLESARSASGSKLGWKGS